MVQTVLNISKAPNGMVTIHQFPFMIKNNFIFTSDYNVGSQNPSIYMPYKVWN
jgi:hypothetical protein